jgi:hypothetical protein
MQVIISLQEGQLRANSFSSTHRICTVWLLIFFLSAGASAQTLAPLPDLATWRPDPLGFFYLMSGSLYYLPIPEGEPIHIYQDLPSQVYENYYRWCQ